ncbi:RNA-directed DNA polymerase, eukaryota [Tanacetum coccineum]
MKNNNEASTKESLEYPLGFTPRENDVENVEMDNQKDNCDGEFGNVNNISDEVNFSSGFNTYKKTGGESMDSDHCREYEGSRKGGSILMLMDELVKLGQTMGYNMDGCMKNIEEIIESQGVDGGILCVWDPNAFKKLNSTASDYFVMIQGNWVSNGKLLLIISVYAPQELSEKKSLWDYLCHVIDNWKGSVIIMGDFNEVRNKNERFGTIFNVHGANAFNYFISMTNLEEVPLGGCFFTRCHRSASKVSKLDRFLMSESLLSECPNLSAITLDRFLSDHRPILLRESTHDYGPIPFRFFHYWLEMEGFENFVNEVWREAPVDNSNAMINMMNKLKYLKKKIRVWNGMRQSPKTQKHVLKQELADLEMIIDKGDASSDTLHKRAEVVKSIQEVDKLCAMEASQKAKIKWAIEGDENSKYYHGILNKKRNQLSIRGVLVEGDWVENPNMVKNEFLNHFKNRFDRPKSVRPMLNMEFPHHLNSMQQLDLEAEVSNEEIKKAVWDCGVDKSPGPDGFTFGFYKRFWSLIEKDVLAAVKYFFHYSRIPKGCNSSFIALIPKTPEAKMVKDFRPISLIGSLYKIIAKILANRLVVVLGDIVNEVQSAFVADRQILDGPFILNEVLQWCKLKKKHSFILKIDFEKAYDSVRWDYLDDVLRKFGFGEKWCGWIQECLRSSWGSVLVNGSPTEEFQFFKGLKQGDPLSPFIFILVMESLHISFKRVVDAGMFNGIVLNSVMHLSHMFYADDAVFMGQWSTKNIDTIIYVLKCFHRASGLSINLSKSKLLGVVVSEDRVVQAANRIGCGVLKAPFAYLGSKVGGNMSRIKSWDEIVDKMVDRLSKWKMKTLSIGGRLTLLKAVLGSMPIYHMSIFKVPMKVLQRMESIRSRFFSGVDLNSKKSIWVKWSKVLCSKEKGGLGVSSLYALNRALMCKWVWRFTTQKNLLWTRVIKAIHGEDGKNGSGFKVGYKSIWRSILQEVETLKIKGIHLNNFMQKKLGNGADTYFWEDLWHGDMVLKQRYPRLYALEVKKTDNVAFKLSQLTDLTTYMEGVVLGVMPDRWYWRLDGSGEFSVASARKVRMDCLPTRLNISQIGIDIPSILCTVCGSITESSSHLFFDCLVAKDNFRKICRWWEVDFMEVHTFDEWVSWIVNLRIPIKHKRLLEGDKVRPSGSAEGVEVELKCVSVPSSCLRDSGTALHSLESCKLIAVGAKLAQPSLEYSFRRNPRGGVEQDQFNELSALVHDVSLIPRSDTWKWDLESSGDFSVASVKKIIDDKSLSDVDSKTRWIKYVPIKVNVHAWKVKTYSLPTRFNVSRRGIDIDSIMCVICDNEVETSRHLFFYCCMVRQIVRKITHWWDVSYVESIDQGPFELGTTRNTLGTTPEGGVLLGPERPRTYEDLSDTEKKRYDADVRATNIVLQGLPKDIYKLINHNIEAKAIWDNVKMLLAGENINEYYVRFHKLVNDMRNIRMTMPNIQLNSKFVNNMSPEWDRFVTAVKLNKGLKETNHEQLYAYLKQHEKHAAQDRLIIERITPTANDQLAFVSTVQPHAPTLHVQSHQYPSSSATPQSPQFPHFPETSQPDSGHTQTDEILDNLTKQMALLAQSFRATLPQTNNQLRTSSNTRNQATIQDASNGGAHNRAGNANAGQGKPVKCYNCNGLGHIARNCTQPKRPQNSDYFKDKMLLMQAQENGAVLDEEELLFLAGEQADVCDAFDSGVDDEPTSQSMF